MERYNWEEKKRRTINEEKKIKVIGTTIKKNQIIK